VIGTVYMDGGRSGRVFTRDDLAFLEAFANQASVAIENARLYESLARERQQLQRTAEQRYVFENFVGQSAPMRKVFDLMGRAAESPLPVLIQGESGTGKELVARALHFNSPRRARVFLSENCAAIPETLLESEVFGYAQGAFTGADRDKKGLFELADGGTLFLDEVAELPLATQAKLLRVLQDGEYRPVGSSEVRRSTARVIAATNADLSQLLGEGKFRQDLYYRLNVIAIGLPPLRDRREDIPLLADHFLSKMARERGLQRLSIDPNLLSVLVRYGWPGNVRQLENVLSRLAVLAPGPRITLADLEADRALYDQLADFLKGPDQIEDLATIEKKQIHRALQETSGNRLKAARMLGISRATIFRKIREYGL
jgi:Nif-specific regulatory protein